MTNASTVALIHGAGCSIGNELAKGMAAEGIRLVFFEEQQREEQCLANAATLAAAGCSIEVLPADLPNASLIERTTTIHGRLDYVFNCLVPGPHTTPASVFEYPQQLLRRNSDAAEAMVACSLAGAIVNQSFLGTLFQDTPLETAIIMARASITGLTRQICCKFGKAGIRINTVHVGLADLPEIEGVPSEKTLARKTPVGRWATPAEISKFMLFLALRNGYMTGQTLCFDGGLTSGNTGT